MNGKHLNILLVEDDTAVARQLESLLEQGRGAAFTLTGASGLEAALAHLAEAAFDLILIDLSLPDGAGLASVKRLQAAAPRVPVIVLGQLDDETVALEAVHEGAQDYLVKSQLNSQLLGRAIRHAIERERADAALLEAEEKYRGIFENIVEGIFQTSPDGQYLSANSALARIYGYASPEELINSVRDIGRKLYVEPHRRAEFIQLMREHDVVTDFESRIFRKDGSIIWIAENVRAIRDSKGRLLYYEGTVEDITQRKFAEDQLRESQSLYHSLVETLPQNIFRKDLRGRFTFVNERFCRTLGRPAAEILGHTDFDFFLPALAAKYQSDDLRILESRQTFETVEQNQLPGGDMSYVQVVKSPIFDAQGNVIGLQGIFWDITPRRRAEEQIRLANEELARSREALRKKNEEMEDDLKMAREIQQTMLPQQYPAFPSAAAPAQSHFRFAHRYLPTSAVGGDYFNVLALSDTEAAVFICDVMGHGVRSALIAAMVRALVEELKPLGRNPGKLLSRLNHDLCAILQHTGSPTLTTAFYLVADAATGQMRFANAGHPKPLLIHRRSGIIKPLTTAGTKSKPALGLFEDAAYTGTNTTLAPGDLIMLFTDGLYEVEGPDGQLYTHEMLLEAVSRRAKLPAQQLFDELLAEIKQFALGRDFADDVCLVAMEVADLPPPPSSK